MKCRRHAGQVRQGSTPRLCHAATARAGVCAHGPCALQPHWTIYMPSVRVNTTAFSALQKGQGPKGAEGILVGLVSITLSPPKGRTADSRSRIVPNRHYALCHYSTSIETARRAIPADGWH